MQVEVSDLEQWIMLDGPYGTDIIPCDVCGNLPDYDVTVEDCPDDIDPDDHYREVAFEKVKDYTKNQECWEIIEVAGYCARLSAPGYVDCADWMGPFDSDKAARHEVLNFYDLCPICEEPVDSPENNNPTCNFHHWE